MYLYLHMQEEWPEIITDIIMFIPYLFIKLFFYHLDGIQIISFW